MVQYKSRTTWRMQKMLPSGGISINEGTQTKYTQVYDNSTCLGYLLPPDLSPIQTWRMCPIVFDGTRNGHSDTIWLITFLLPRVSLPHRFGLETSAATLIPTGSSIHEVLLCSLPLGPIRCSFITSEVHFATVILNTFMYLILWQK